MDLLTRRGGSLQQTIPPFRFFLFPQGKKELKDRGWKNKKKQLKKQLLLLGFNNQTRKMTTPYGGCLGSHEDEERSEMRYVVRIAGTSESSSF